MVKAGGIVYLVGAGPGDPGLLTRRGAEVLARADVVVYDHLASPRLLDLAPASALRVCAGKSVGHCTLSQGEINALLVEHAREGRGWSGSRGATRSSSAVGPRRPSTCTPPGIPVQVVPGVTAGVGVSTYAGIPITHRDAASAVAFVTGHDDPESPTSPSPLDWEALARFPGTLVIYMGVTRLERLCRTLIRLGKPATTPAALVQSGTLATQRTVVATLADLAARAIEGGFGPPALVIIGEVVGARPALNWFEGLPLFGQRIVVTRPAGESELASASLEALGAEALAAPTVTIEPPDDFGPIDEALARLRSFDWLVFTSGNGVRHFLDRLESRGLDLRALGHLKLAAIGPATAEALGRYRLKADLVPDSFRSEALAEALAPHVVGRRVLLARADRGRTVLKDELRRVAHVEQVAVYRNLDAGAIDPVVLGRIAEGSVDWITLTSSAITERLHALLPEEARRRIGGSIRLASLSPVTSATAERLGWPIAAEAGTYTWDGLVAAIVERVALDREAARTRAMGRPFVPPDYEGRRSSRQPHR